MKKLSLLLIFISVTAIFSQTEFIVNTVQEENQRDPQIARDADGNYVVVWKNEAYDTGDISLQIFNSSDEKVRDELVVNTVTDGEQERPKIAMNSNGDYVVVWASHSGAESIFDIKAKLYKAVQSAPVETEILVNTFTEGSQTKPSVDIDEDGNFIVVWESWFQDGSDKGIYAQKFNSEGNKVGDEFLINTTTKYSQGRPIVKYLNNGNIIVIWESWQQEVATNSGYGIIAKIFSNDGTVVKDEFAVNTYTNDHQWFGDIVINDDDSFVITWCSWEQDGHDGGIYLQKFDSEGIKLGNELLVNQNTEYYQWLPKITKMETGEYAVIWSSWQQDGSREGIYVRYFDSEFKLTSLENKLNDYTEDYQWEPSVIPTEGNEILVVWSSWDQTDNKYEIVAKRGKSSYPQGKIEDNTINHNNGQSTSIIKVHVIDSTSVTGDEYEVSFIKNENWFSNIINKTTREVKVSNLKLSTNPLSFNLSPVFDGISVEYKLDYELKLDTSNSHFKTSSGTNLSFVLGRSGGVNVIAPVNMALIWGTSDTLSDGNYSSPLSQAYNGSGELKVECPFMLWNLDDNEQVDLFIQESVSNDKWDVNESINILTPAQYQASFPNFHGMLTAVYESGNLIMPSEGDTLFINTIRPISTADKYSFTTNSSNIISSLNNEETLISKFRLEQNYPNPFNPSTTIEFEVPSDGLVKLNIYNILGQKVETLVNEVKKQGTYKKLFNGKSLASGIYFYTFEFRNKIISKKMILLK